jgi:CheY-like chemotaxis protein
MSVNGRGATAPGLTNADQDSLREFWDVYESRFAEIGPELAHDSAAHPELASFVGAGDAESVTENRKRIAQAINEGGRAMMRLPRHLHEVPGPAATEGRVRLLMADDDRRVRMLVRAQMAGTEIEVLEAIDGHHALMRAEEGMPDAALLDWRMPGGGLPLARALIEDHGLAGRVIMLSSIADPRDRLEARRAGVVRYMVKPPDRDVLLAAVRAVAAHSRVA